MKATLRPIVAAAMLLGPLAASFVAQPAQAATASQPHITALNLDSDAGLSPGATLRVQVAATPDARDASVTLGDSGITVPLQQQSPGKYAGSYTVRRGDRIDPRQRMTARLDLGEHSTSRAFNYPPAFQALASGSARPTARGDSRNEDRESLARDDHDGDRMAREDHMRRDERSAGAPGGMPLQINTPNNLAVDANGNITIEGRTAPLADVHVHMEALADAAGVTQPVADLTVRADRSGYFAAIVPPRPGAPLPGTRFNVRVTATSGDQTAQERITLVQRQG